MKRKILIFAAKLKPFKSNKRHSPSFSIIHIICNQKVDVSRSFKNYFSFSFTFTFHGGMLHDSSQTFNQSSQYPSWRFLIGGRTNSRSIFVIFHDVGMFHWRGVQPPAFRQNCTSLWCLCNLLIIHRAQQETCSKPTIKCATKNPPI